MLTIPQVMSHKPRVVKESDTIKQVAEVLASEEFHALPVVKDNDESVLAGIVTTTDVIRYMLEQTK
jgi:CBS domain-containing protein